MPVTIDLTRLSSAAAALFCVSPLTEMVSALHTVTMQEHHYDVDLRLRRWLAGLEGERRATFARFTQLWKRFKCRLFFPLRVDASTMFDDQLATIASLPLRQFVQLAGEGIYGFTLPPDVFDPSLSDFTVDAAAADRLRKLCAQAGEERLTLVEELLADPRCFRDDLLAFLQYVWDAVFREIWREIERVLVAEAVARTRELRRKPLADVLLGISPLILPMRDGRVRIDKLQRASLRPEDGGLIILPSVFAGFHLTVKWSVGYPQIIQYPVERENDSLGLREIHAKISALNSYSRLEIFRFILAESLTTSEIALRLGMTKSQVSNGLQRLKEAGLVVSHRGGRFVYHRGNMAELRKLSKEIVDTLLR